MKKLSQHFMVTSTILILTLLGLAYAVWIPFLGFYREDWYVIWNGVTRGANEFISMYASERPLMGYLYAILYPLFGNSAWLWGAYAFALRVLATILFWKLVSHLWPEPRWLATLAASLFALYPGFLQQVQPNCFQMHWHGITLAVLSLFSMVKAIKSKEQWQCVAYRVIALLSTAIYPFTMEYYIGLEGTRAAVLLLVMQKKQPERLDQALLRWLREWLPYGVVIAGFLLWRAFVFETDRPTINIYRILTTYSSGYAYFMVRLVLELFRDTFESVVMAWFVPLYEQWYYGDYKLLLLGCVFALVGVGLFAGLWKFVVFDLRHTEQQSSTRGEVRSAMMVGLFGVISALFPVVATLQAVRFTARDDRFTLPASLGVAILMAGLVASIPKDRVRNWIIGAFVFSSLLTHFYNSRYMIDYWQIQRQVWWQLSWRAPNIKRNTFLMVKLPPPYSFAEDYEIWAPANLLYYPDQSRPRLGGEVIYSEAILQLQWKGKETRRYRGIYINRDFDNPLILSLPNIKSCLHIFNGIQAELSSQSDPWVRLAARYSKIERILVEEEFQQPDEQIFGVEPPHSWCYYYQKASYYRQKGDWKAVIQLAKQVNEQHLKPYDVYEWLPFFVAHAMEGERTKAEEVAQHLLSDPNLVASLCRQWTEAPLNQSTEDLATLRAYLCVGPME